MSVAPSVAPVRPRSLEFPFGTAKGILPARSWRKLGETLAARYFGSFGAYRRRLGDTAMRPDRGRARRPPDRRRDSRTPRPPSVRLPRPPARPRLFAR